MGLSSPRVAKKVTQRAISGKKAKEEAAPLTEREIEVLRLMTRGMDNAQIAETLAITEHTVKFHVSNIYSKLGVRSRTEAVLLVLRSGLAGI